jgi:hypothetical protein
MSRRAKPLRQAVERCGARARSRVRRMPRLYASQRHLSGFASAIIRRYANREIMRPVIEMLLRRRLPDVTLRSYWRQTHVYMTPRLALSTLTGPTTRLEDDTAPGSPTGPVCVGRLIETFVRHLTAREVRTESVWVAGGSAFTGEPVSNMSASTSSVTGGQPAQIIYRTQSVRVPDSPKEAGRDVLPARGTKCAPGPLESRPRDSRWARAISDVDIGDLTDKVVQALDRRILAYRERLGRR